MKNENLTVNKIILLFCMIVVLLHMVSCDDMEDKLKPVNNTGIAETTQLYVLSEGLFNMNNSTLASYNLNDKTLVTDFFLTVNKRGLGDTANDMGIYGSKLYIVVNASSNIEIIDSKTGISIKQVRMVNNANKPIQPRFIEFSGGKAYVSCFDGTVAKIDTSTLQIESFVKCGNNPDGICVANNKLYVSNSGGLNFPDYDNTVSIIDIATFTEIKKVTVGKNPTKIHSDSYGNVYVISLENYVTSEYKFQKINSLTDELTNSFDNVNAMNFTIQHDTAYFYNYNFSTKKYFLKTFDCKTNRIISENFITDGTELSTPYSINVNPSNGDVYLTDSKSFTVSGDVLCFDRTGKLKFKIEQIGLNPNKVIFL